jgi:hypothetical protein
MGRRGFMVPHRLRAVSAPNVGELESRFIPEGNYALEGAVARR